MSRRELEGVLAHEMSHVRNRDVQVTTLAVTTVGLLVVVADISARGSFFADWGDGDNNNDGGAFVAPRDRRPRRRARVRRAAAVARHLAPPGGARRHERGRDRVARRPAPRAREARSRPHRAAPRVARDRAPLARHAARSIEGDARHAKTNRLFDTHPPLAERIAILRKLEGLDPNDRGPVDETSTGVPVDLAKLTASTDRRTARGRRRADAQPACAGDRGRRLAATHARRRQPDRLAVAVGDAAPPPASRRAGTTPTGRPSATGTASAWTDWTAELERPPLGAEAGPSLTGPTRCHGPLGRSA